MDIIEEEHPIPQQISSYQFRLVGDMTIKQFFQVAAGALISLLIYSSNLASYIKWPLILISFLTGIAFAFFPLQDRPLSKWVSLFIKAIYSPTLYVWNKSGQKKNYFTPEPQEQTPLKPQVSRAGITPLKTSVQAAIQEELKPYEEPIQKKLNLSEENFLTQINKQFSVVETVKPQIQTQVIIPKKSILDVGFQTKQVESPQEYMSGTLSQRNVTPQAGNVIKDVQSAQFSPEAAPPMPPSKANVVVGQILTQSGKIIENAILEIRDSEGHPVRALKSNRLGHFMIVTPLSDGTYQITIERDGFSFEPISINLSGQILEPIIIKGKEVSSSQF